MFFHLWNGGGPNYLIEHRNWLTEESDSWTNVARSKISKSQTIPLTGANAIPVRNSIFKIFNGSHSSRRDSRPFSHSNSNLLDPKSTVFPPPQAQPKTKGIRIFEKQPHSGPGILGHKPAPLREPFRPKASNYGNTYPSAKYPPRSSRLLPPGQTVNVTFPFLVHPSH